jgi:hypothetical protein
MSFYYCSYCYYYCFFFVTFYAVSVTIDDWNNKTMLVVVVVVVVVMSLIDLMHLFTCCWWDVTRGTWEAMQCRAVLYLDRPCVDLGLGLVR